jgi:very-short-patch-repair endonuclease
MLYNSYSDIDKQKLLTKLYIDQGLSFHDIATQLDTYPNKVRRDAMKFQIPIRDKSTAQQNALKTGKHKHPTKGHKRSEQVKNKIGKSVMDSYESLPDDQKDIRKEKARQRWDSLSEDEKKERLSAANKAVRVSSKVGSKLEHFLLKRLIKDGYSPEFHKEQVLSNTKLQIDLYLPTIATAIEIDGPSHFLPVWGEESLKKNIEYDNKKSGLIIGKGLNLVRIKQTHDFSEARANEVYVKLIEIISNHNQVFTQSKIVEIED